MSKRIINLLSITVILIVGCSCLANQQMILAQLFEYAGRGGAWTPADLVNISGWWDGSDDTTLIKSGSSITNWIDKSGNGYDLIQTTVSKAPTTEDVSGMQYVRFTASADQDISSESWVGTNYIFQNTFVVASMNSATESNARMITQSRSDVNDYETIDRYIQFLRPLTANQIAPNYRSVYANLDVSLGDLFIAETYHTTSHIVASLNATTSVSNAIDNYLIANLGVIRFGSVFFTPELYWDGYINEVIISPQNLSQSDRQKVEGYLAHKWGLEANLPVDHPYKSSPPTN